MTCLAGLGNSTHPQESEQQWATQAGLQNLPEHKKTKSGGRFCRGLVDLPVYDCRTSRFAQRAVVLMGQAMLDYKTHLTGIHLTLTGDGAGRSWAGPSCSTHAHI